MFVFIFEWVLECYRGRRNSYLLQGPASSTVCSSVEALSVTFGDTSPTGEAFVRTVREADPYEMICDFYIHHYIRTPLQSQERSVP